MATPTKLTQQQINELKEKAKHFRDNGGNVLVPAVDLLLLLNAYPVNGG